MEDSSGNSKWFWLLGGVALIVAVVGLLLAISAKNSTVDTNQVVNEATAQLKGELSGLGGALKAGKELQNRETAQAARDRARIKRAVAAAVNGAKSRIGRLSAEVANLKSEAAKTQTNVANLQKSEANLANAQKNLAVEVQTLKKRLNRFTSSGPR
jgi:chromosome segregation ATPase